MAVNSPSAASLPALRCMATRRTDVRTRMGALGALAAPSQYTVTRYGALAPSPPNEVELWPSRENRRRSKRATPNRSVVALTGNCIFFGMKPM